MVLIIAVADEYKMAEVDRALRDAKADLSATRTRLGRATEEREDCFSSLELASMKVGTEILAKTGRKPA